MMDRQDIAVGVGGEGGISDDGIISENVGGYLPIIEQGESTAGGCRYRQAINPGPGGFVDADTNFGLVREYLSHGSRSYVPQKQPTAQEVLLKTLQRGPTTILLLGGHTNLALLLMSHPEVKSNIEHIYLMGGSVNGSNPTGCCPKGSSDTSCSSLSCGTKGNLFSAFNSNPDAEFNVFMDPFAAFQVFHSGRPITEIPLDVTNQVPITKLFINDLEKTRETLEANYAFQTFKMIRDTWYGDGFFKNSYFLWDTFASAVAISGMLNGHDINLNKYAVLEYKNVTVVTSDQPYGVQDSSDPFFYNRTTPRFHLQKNGVHSGHVERGIEDPFCFNPNGRGTCKDGAIMEVLGEGGARIQVAVKPKKYVGGNSTLGLQIYEDYLHDLNKWSQRGRFSFKTDFPNYKRVFYQKHDSSIRGKPVVFDMDMSPGDMISLFYLLKAPVELIDLKAVTVTATGWANAAAIDIVYDMLHMMGRDDVDVGLGSYFALNQPFVSYSTNGDCKYQQAIPNGAGGMLDSDTLFGFARELPQSPRGYTAQNSVEFGAPRNTEHPKERQPLANEVLLKVFNRTSSKERVTILASGPLTNIATFLSSYPSFQTKIEELYITGGSIQPGAYSWPKVNPEGRGNLFTIPQNKDAEFNFFLDPEAAHQVLNSSLNITLIPIDATGQVPLSETYLEILKKAPKTAELSFVYRLLSRIWKLHKTGDPYKFTNYLVGETLAAAVLVNPHSIKTMFNKTRIQVEATGDISTDGVIRVDPNGTPIRYVSHVDSLAYIQQLTSLLSSPNNTAVVPSYKSQKLKWKKC
ncbi:hypothetical protein O6H91_19G008000 [Diphasiastrum complanatum]|nr:hypothetical protein O6H91_19G008000 [Diphasiastrum complanatum]